MERLRRVLTNLSVVALFCGLALVPLPAGATIIFDNFDLSDGYNTGVGYTLGAGVDATQGDAFVVPGGIGYRLDTVELAISRVSGANELMVALRADAGGLPGAVLEVFSFSGAMGPFGSANPPLLATSLLRPTLTAGTQYWLIASVPAGVHSAWNLNSIGDSGPHASSTMGSPFLDFDTTRGAFRVTASPVPEPGTGFLLASGLLGTLGIRRRRRS